MSTSNSSSTITWFLSQRTVLPNEENVEQTTKATQFAAIKPAAIKVENGKIVQIVTDLNEITEIKNKSTENNTTTVHDMGQSILMCGLFDSHVHCNEPGREHWEGLETATHAASHGGVTTIIDMPLNSIPSTVTVDAMKQKIQAAKGKLHVDVGLWGGIGNSEHKTPSQSTTAD